MSPQTAAFRFHRATPLAEGGVAVFELYGEGAADALRKAFRSRQGGPLPGPGRARLGEIADPSGEAIDEAVLTRVPAEGMWSRLEAWTISVHAGLWIQEKLAAVLATLGGLEADTREVLRQALAAGALDAVEAAAYELLLGALTEKAARFFARQYSGELSRKLREGLALAEKGDLRGSLDLIGRLLEASRPAFRLGHPLRALIAGRPNAGKSTLFNRLVEEERAAVTPAPGTTRDLLEETIRLEGFPIAIADGPGIRSWEEVGPVERAGIERLLARDDDVVLYLLPPPWRRAEEDDRFLSRFPPTRRLIVGSFADLLQEGPGAAPPGVDVFVSALSGEGMPLLCGEILARWIAGSGEAARLEAACAPFTRVQVSLLAGAAAPAQNEPAAASLDALRRAYLKCLGSSWPEAEDR